MVSRENIGNEILEIVESILSQEPINAIHPNYINLPNPKLKYLVVKGRRLEKCEEHTDITIYFVINDIKDKSDGSRNMSCTRLTDVDLIIGIIRKENDATYINDLERIFSLITDRFGTFGNDYTFPYIKLGGETFTDICWGEIGVYEQQTFGSVSNTDKCGVFQRETIARLSFDFHR